MTAPKPEERAEMMKYTTLKDAMESNNPEWIHVYNYLRENYDKSLFMFSDVKGVSFEEAVKCFLWLDENKLIEACFAYNETYGEIQHMDNEEVVEAMKIGRYMSFDLGEEQGFNVDNLTLSYQVLSRSAFRVPVGSNETHPRILGVAIWDPTDTTKLVMLPAPKRHADLIPIWDEVYGEALPPMHVQGFYTIHAHGQIQLLTRNVAARMAFKAGQIDAMKDTLFSEDVW